MKKLLVSMLILLAAACSPKKDFGLSYAKAKMVADDVKQEMLKLCFDIPATEEVLGQELLAISKSKDLSDRQEHQQIVGQLQSELAVMRSSLKNLEESDRRFDTQEKTTQELLKQSSSGKAMKEQLDRVIEQQKKNDKLSAELGLAVSDLAEATSATLRR
ncbi:MAG: hypothetical protein NTY66_00535 [Candidatus Vogelbacteria bacterium]|nr:hypothetical protein [Candidatus Vogelbacteria bacterium]